MELKNEVIKEILLAMDDFKELAIYLRKKLTSEYKRDEILEFVHDNSKRGVLSEDWNIWVHGMHFKFWNNVIGQVINISLFGSNILDPGFFYQFIETSEKHKYLTKYLEDNPYKKMKDLFIKLNEEEII